MPSFKAGFSQLAQQDAAAGVERDTTEPPPSPRSAADDAADVAPTALDVAGQAAAAVRRNALKSYTVTRFVGRLLAPQLALLLLLALLGFLCFGGGGTAHVHETHIHLTVGPGCVAQPKTDKPVAAKYNAVDNITCPVEAPESRPHLGPIVSL